MESSKQLGNNPSSDSSGDDTGTLKNQYMLPKKIIEKHSSRIGTARMEFRLC